MNKVKHQIGEYTNEEFEELIKRKYEQAKIGQLHAVLVKEKIKDKLYDNWLYSTSEDSE